MSFTQAYTKTYTCRVKDIETKINTHPHTHKPHTQIITITVIIIITKKYRCRNIKMHICNSKPNVYINTCKSASSNTFNQINITINILSNTHAFTHLSTNTDKHICITCPHRPFIRSITNNI